MTRYSHSKLSTFEQCRSNYKDSEKLAPLVREISWAKNIIIMEKCKEEIAKKLEFLEK